MSDWGALFLRVSFSLTMIIGHGQGKLMQLFGPDPIQFADPFGLGPTISLALATFGEFLCPIFLIIGFKTRLFAIPAIITMLTAAFIAHATAPFFPGWVMNAVAEHPVLITPNKEFAALYLFAFISIMLVGPGRISVDQMMRKN